MIANSKEEFVELIDKAMKLDKQKNIEYYETLKQEAMDNTWEAKAKLIIELLQKYE